MGELLSCIEGCPDWWSGYALPKFKSNKDSSNCSVRESQYVTAYVLHLYFLEGFYSAEESITVVLTKPFDFLYNDDCFAGDWVIIILLGGW